MVSEKQFDAVADEQDKQRSERARVLIFGSFREPHRQAELALDREKDTSKCTLQSKKLATHDREYPNPSSYWTERSQ